MSTVVLILAALVLSSTSNSLEVAKSLAKTKYKGWTYGTDKGKKQIDCVQFVAATLQEDLQLTLARSAREAVLINYQFKDLTKAVVGEDVRTKGVQNALVNILKRGKVVPAKDAKPGDFIQYWMKKKDGTWFGHAGILASVEKTKEGKVQAVIYGAHQSLGKIGDSKFKLNLTGSNRRIYLCRVTR